MSLRTNLAVIATALALAGCGEDGESVASLPAPSATPAPDATPAAANTPTPTATGTPTATATAAPTEEGGDEDGNRPGLQFDLSAAAVSPDRVEVPAFLGLRIRLRNRTEEPRAISLDGRPLTVLEPGATKEVDAEGLRPGAHALDAGASGSAEIVAIRAGG